METSKSPVLRKPGDFWHTHRRELPIRSYGALRYHLERRRENGLVQSGAVIESPIGLLIAPERFEQWLLGSGRRQHEGGGG
jgi:hypothetical protein